MPITISGVGVNVTIELEEGATAEDALAAAGFEDTSELDVAVNGEPVEAGTEVTENDSVVATPKKAELG